jgi:hypothetical protein
MHTTATALALAWANTIIDIIVIIFFILFSP